mmetsp:Transcript_5344/g.10069  ORF Transcript_5344/g.10069 Transcript_5344/m.10069 type:complete len:481 (+) Transcript_5344:100-1542(+)
MLDAGFSTARPSTLSGSRRFGSPAVSPGIRARAATFEQAAQNNAKLSPRQQPAPVRRPTGVKPLVPVDRPSVPEAVAVSNKSPSPRVDTQAVATLRPKWRLTCISEQRVLKAGVLRLHKEWAVPSQDTQNQAFPTKPDGSPLIMQSSFIRRLLNASVELKTCAPSDVSAAQMDLRHLNTEQLLRIRAGALDFSTDSDSHNAHRSFLSTVDGQLFTKLARRFVRGEAVRLDQFYRLGVYIVLMLGAQQVLKEGPQQNINSTGPPKCWAVRCEESDGKSILAVFNTEEYWLEILPSDNIKFCNPAFGNQLGVVCDRSTGTGPVKRLHWEIVTMDPKVDDIAKELTTSKVAEKKKLSMELSAAVERHCSPRSHVLGLPASPKIEPRGSSPGPLDPLLRSSGREKRMSEAMLRRMVTFTASPQLSSRELSSRALTARPLGRQLSLNQIDTPGQKHDDGAAAKSKVEEKVAEPCKEVGENAVSKK